MKIKPIASLIAVTAAALGFMAPAQAEANLVPEQEGEIDVGLGYLDPAQSVAIELFPFVKSITSVDGSRLFIDNLGTENTYGDVTFGTVDRGTNPENYWFRASNDKEGGLLETGTFTFEFTKTLKALNIDFFDTETEDTTGVTAIDGVDLGASVDWIAKGKDGNVATQTFNDVNSITLKLGGPRDGWKYGDGVSFRAQATPVPEPATLTGLAVVGLAFAGQKLRKGRKA